MSIRYEVEGHPLTALPEGYAPHYIPEGFVYSEEDSYQDECSFRNYYTNAEGYSIALMCGLQRGLVLCSRIRSTRISGRSNMETAKHGWVRLRTATAICFLGLRVVLNTICISMPFYRNPRCSGLRTIFIKYRVKTAEPGRQEIRPGSVFLHKNWAWKLCRYPKITKRSIFFKNAVVFGPLDCIRSRGNGWKQNSRSPNSIRERL